MGAWGVLKATRPDLETTVTYGWYVSHDLIGCLAGMLDLRAIGKGKRGMHSVPMEHTDW
jgi:hypothetical protein